MSETVSTYSLKWLLIILVVLTILTLLVKEVSICPKGGTCEPIIQKFRALTLNEMGDTLAGVFSPLAFIIAIFALLLQSRELAQSRIEASKSAKALQSQAAILAQREKGEQFEELLIAIVQYSRLPEVTWVFENEGFPEDTYGRNMEVNWHFQPENGSSNDETIVALGEHLCAVDEQLNDFFNRHRLPEDPRVYSGHRPTELLGYCTELSGIFPNLSPAKQQRFRNLKIEDLDGALTSLVANTEWWRP